MRSILIFLLSLGICQLYAQNKQVIYGFDEIPQSLMLNPGTKVPQKAHFGIPFLSQIHINGGSSGVSVFDIFGTTGEDINSKIERKIFEMTDKDFFTLTQQLEILQFGWRTKNDIYFSGGLYQELDFISYFPQDLAILAWEGNRDYLGYEFDLGQISTTGDLLTVYHFGANKSIGKKLTVGARVKLYSSMLSYQSTNNQGVFVTELGDENSNNIYEHRVVDADVQVQTSGIAALTEEFTAGKLIGRGFFGGNFGVGVDLGATYELTEQLTLTASVLDLGTIFHSKDVENYRASGDYILDGIELIFPSLSEGEATLPYYDDLEDEIEREIPIDTLYDSYSQLRPLKVNASARYNFGKIVGGGQECDCRNMGGGVTRAQAVGVQFFSILRPKGPQMAGTLFYERRLFEFLAAKATYTIDPYSFSNLGLGVVTDAGKFNFYVAADNILRYGNIAKAKGVSLQFGFNIKIDEE